MYRLLLCQRYLRTRYIALASIISVTLGVATMIVVNSVMAGFQQEMHHRLRGILADLLVEAHSMEGIADPEEVLAEIRQELGDDIAGMTCNVHVPAMVSFRVRDQWQVRQVNLIGIDPDTYSSVGDFGQYLLHPENRQQMEFRLRERGYDARMNERMDEAGWTHRHNRVLFERAWAEQQEMLSSAHTWSTAAGDSPPWALAEDSPSANPPPAPIEDRPTDESPPAASESEIVNYDPFQASTQPHAGELFDPMTDTHAGIVLGIGVISLRHRNPDGKVSDYFVCKPGDDVKVTLPSAGAKPQPKYKEFTIVDVYESKMSEYDANFAFVPLRSLQDVRWYPGEKRYLHPDQIASGSKSGGGL